MPQTRLVIVDPSHASSVGHHDEVNRPLLAAFQRSGWQPELWADVSLEADITAPQPMQGVFSGCGYEDPRLWSELGGLMQLGRRMEQQLQLASATGGPVAVWLGHSLLPFQLLGLARHLATAPAAQVVLSLMFAPGETLSQELSSTQATANCRIALAAVARATAQRGHRLQLVFPSRQQEELYAPLLGATGLRSAGLHPAVVGAGCRPAPPAPAARPMVLLHWGDLKAGKGYEAALAVLAALRQHGTPRELEGWGWLFHSHSRDALKPADQETLRNAEAAGLGLQWLRGPVASQTMVNALAACPLALLAYDPQRYRERSSGILWQWAASRLAAGLPASGIGYGSGWLCTEAQQLGLGWESPASGKGTAWLEAVVKTQRQLSQQQPLNRYAQEMLQHSFAQWCTETALAAGPSDKLG